MTRTKRRRLAEEIVERSLDAGLSLRVSNADAALLRDAASLDGFSIETAIKQARFRRSVPWASSTKS